MTECLPRCPDKQNTLCTNLEAIHLPVFISSRTLGSKHTSGYSRGICLCVVSVVVCYSYEYSPVRVLFRSGPRV